MMKENVFYDGASQQYLKNFNLLREQNPKAEFTLIFENGTLLLMAFSVTPPHCGHISGFSSKKRASDLETLTNHNVNHNGI